MLARMAQDPPERVSPPKSDRPPAKSGRLAREAAALRANLRKRKDQARQRAAPSDTPKDA